MFMKLSIVVAATAILGAGALATKAQPVGGGAPSAMTTPSTQTSSPPVTPAGPATTNAKTPDQQIICKHEDEIGSRLGGKRVCMTKAQWAQQAQDARDAADGAQRQPH
jgi:hypothetical protein